MTPLYYKIRMVKNGPLVACKVWYGNPSDPDTGEEMDRAPRWQCWVNGALIEDAFRVVMLIDDQPPIVKGEEIDELTYNHMLAVKDWAVQYAPNEPEATPRKAIDLGKIPPIF